MAFETGPEPQRPSIGERLDTELGLNEQTLEAFEVKAEQDRKRIDALEARVAFLEQLLLGGEHR